MDYANVDDFRSFVLTASKLPYFLARQRKKGREALAPLIHELPPMYKNKRADTSFSDKAGCKYTLHGCVTGMNFVAGGDELIGLQRGLFFGGATSLLLSLWDVHDDSTTELMVEFYRNYIQTDDVAGSLQRAMQQMRKNRPHPYFWAPFVLVGKIAAQINHR